jgi:DNA-binding NtrC family response regulator
MKIKIPLLNSRKELETSLSDISVQRRKGNILIVDENPLTRKPVKVALSSLNYETREAETALQALKAIEVAPTELILIALLTPDLSLTEFTERIQYRYPEITIFFLSSSLSTWMKSVRNRNLIPIVSSHDLADLTKKVEEQFEQNCMRKKRAHVSMSYWLRDL